MTKLKFTFEFLNEIENLDGKFEDGLRQEAEARLRELSEDHTDLIGAAVSLELLTKGDESPHLYQARVVAYVRPENIAGVSKENDVALALNQALDNVERQIREQRTRLQQRTQKAAAAGANQRLYELSMDEIYRTYTSGSLPDVWLEIPRDQIAADLMRDEKLNQDDAFYAADQILAAAADRVGTSKPSPS